MAWSDSLGASWSSYCNLYEKILAFQKMVTSPTPLPTIDALTTFDTQISQLLAPFPTTDPFVTAINTAVHNYIYNIPLTFNIVVPTQNGDGSSTFIAAETGSLSSPPPALNVPLVSSDDGGDWGRFGTMLLTAHNTVPWFPTDANWNTLCINFMNESASSTPSIVLYAAPNNTNHTDQPTSGSYLTFNISYTYWSNDDVALVGTVTGPLPPNTYTQTITSLPDDSTNINAALAFYPKAS